jgi:hypothetical protein
MTDIHRHVGDISGYAGAERPMLFFEWFERYLK